MKIWRFGFVIFGLLTCLLVSGPVVANTFESRLKLALEKTEKIMVGAKARSDVVFIVSQAGLLTGRNAHVALDKDVYESRNLGLIQAAEYRLWELREMKLPRVDAHEKIDASPGFFGNKESLLEQDDIFLWVLQLMQKAISCSPGFNDEESIGPPYYGYVASHQLLAMLIARSNGCIDRATFSGNVKKYIGRVYAEMLSNEDELTDLQVERMAFVALAGRPDLVKPSMVEKLLETQSENGVWQYDMQMDHTTALAYLVLSAVYAEKFPSH